jgi:peptidyl-prolyl cis-trans isomerase B (cyclophilin B)
MIKNPHVSLCMENGNVMEIELYPATAPITVNSFISLIKKKFFDGLTFHRVISGFVIQGGCPDGTGLGAPGYSIKGEFSENGIKSTLKHTKGIISMARDDNPDSAGSQFFIVHADTARLDGKYAAFGKVLTGFGEVDRIASVDTDDKDKPLVPEIIKTITVDCFGETYPEPEIIID